MMLLSEHFRLIEALDPVLAATSGPAQIVRLVTERGWRRVYVDGGQLIQSFLRDDLIDDLTIMRVPILLGACRPQFGRLPRDVQFVHVSTRAFPSALVQSNFRRA